MASILWTGKVSLPLRLLINLAAIMAWITGKARKPSIMKEKVKEGYEGKISDYVTKYDDLASSHYEKIATALMGHVDCRGKRVVDIGCGTGILSFIGVEKGAAHMSCVDPSRTMLDTCKKKSLSMGYSSEVISFAIGDSKRLPFEDATFDVVLSNMVLGMIPDQKAALLEFTRILRPGGTFAMSAHGPAHYMEAIEAGVKSLKLQYFLDHRFEFWPRNERKIKQYLAFAGLQRINTKRLIWKDNYQYGQEVFDFFASTTGLWFFHRLPAELRKRETERTRNFFQRKQVTSITSDVVFAYGEKKQEIN